MLLKNKKGAVATCVQGKLVTHRLSTVRSWTGEWKLRTATYFNFVTVKMSYFLHISVNIVVLLMASRSSANTTKAVSSACDTICTCGDKDVDFVVDCSKRDLKEVPQNIPANVTILKLFTNRIEELPLGTFDNTPNLTQLHVSRNYLTQLHPKLFAKTPRLYSGTFSYNFLQEIPGKLFETTPNVEILIFKSNIIKSIHKATFYATRKLKSLVLTNNNLTSLPKKLFAFSKNLKILMLSYNDLHYLPDDIFNNMSSLTTLRLENNEISSLPSGILSGVPYAESIDLSANNFAELPENFLSSVRSLKKIRLRANRLALLPANLFDSTPELDNLTLSSNQLRTIPEYLFNNTPNIKTIDFISNQLKELPAQLFASIHEIRHLLMSGNQIDKINKNLFSKVLLNEEMDFSNNSISHIPDGLFSSNEKSHQLETLFLQRNNLVYIQKGAFDGLSKLSILCLFDNRIEAIDNGAFSLKELSQVFLFNNAIQRITNNSFSNHKLEQIHLYGNNITEMTNDATKGLFSNPTWLLNCELLQTLRVSNITIQCFNDNFAPEIKIDALISRRLMMKGFVCNYIIETIYYRCTLCKPGTYSRGDNNCYFCPRGGFYQETVGVKASSVFEVGCKRCNNGTFVNFAGGSSIEDCQVCPEGTYKNMSAGFRACHCKDGFARTDRFGPCYRCNQTGLNCSGLQDYQTVMKGYYWYWHFTGADNEGYRKFVNNLLEESESFDNNSFYSHQIPRVHRCPRPDSCNTNQTGDAPVRGTCSEGYTGWLCDKCSRGYFSLLLKCLKCPSTSVLVVETLFAAALAVTICYLIWKQYVKHKRRNADERNLLDIIVSRIKICLGFYQVLGEFFSSIKDVRWIGMFDFMGEIFSYIRLNILLIFFRPQCFDDSLNINPKVEFIIAVVTIFSLTVLPFFLYHVMKAYLRFSHRDLNIENRVRTMKAKISTISLVLLFVTYPPICTSIFQIYDGSCIEFCSDLYNQSCRQVLRSDFELKCTDLGAYRVLAYLTTVIYIISFPVVVFYLLRKYCAIHEDSDLLNNESTSLLSVESDDMNIPIGLKFLCENYKPQFWYWEIVELTRKVTQTALLTLLGWEDKLTVLFTIGVSVLFLTLHARYRPMKSVLEQRLQMFSLSVILINVLVTAMSMTVPDQYEQRLAVIILLLNISVIVILIVEAVLGVVIQLKRLKFYRRIYDPQQFQQSLSINSESTEDDEHQNHDSE